MKSDEALRIISSKALGRWVIFTTHAKAEMADELSDAEECIEALRTADSCCASSDVGADGATRWVVVNTPASLSMVCEIRRNVVVITVFGRT